MLQKDTFRFLKALKKNNNREWFAENKVWYERSRADFEKLVAQLIHSISEFDWEVKYLEPKKCIFRIYRDTRFSQDKTPYKTHFGAVFSEKKGSGYYIHLDPEGSFLSCGHYMLTPEQLKEARKGIYNDFDTFRQILDEENFKKEFGDLCRDEDTLKRVPNDFDKEHPAAEYMKLKHFYVMKSLSEEKLFREDLVEYASGIYKQVQPLNEFLNQLIT
ncbi:MAG: DUF2461 domain-containing protein [Flavobacteriaceae bacterium]|nr:DUF2461 domain-containing protein [Flavobacteriaceae bacterium]